MEGNRGEQQIAIVIKTKLLYGMETVQLTEAMMKRIDAFQMKGLRKILGKKHTYWDREATNENILDQANWIINQQKGKRENTRNTKSKRENTKTEKGRRRVKMVICGQL